MAKEHEYIITVDPPRSIVVKGSGALEPLVPLMGAKIVDTLDGQLADVPFTSDNAMKLRHYLKGRDVYLDRKTRTIMGYLADHPEAVKDAELMWSVELIDLLGYKAPGRFNKIKTGWDLLHYMPLRYLDKSNPQSVEQLEVGSWSVVAGIIAADPEWNQQKDFVKIIVEDVNKRRISAVFFRQKWLRFQYKKDDEVIIYGNYSEYVNKMGSRFPQLTNPKIDKLGSLRGGLDMIPIYPQKQADKSWQLQVGQQEMLNKIIYIEDPVPEALLEQFNLLPRDEAYRKVHFPNNKEDVDRARERIAFDEFVRLQVFLEDRRNNVVEKKGTSKNLKNWANQFEAALPFKFTQGQKNALAEISTDMASDHPMYRLLQGDVGSGKAQDLDSLILTPNGFKRMGDMRINDVVLTPDGKTDVIVGIYPQGIRPIYELTFKDGTKARADEEHLWLVRGNKQYNRAGKIRLGKLPQLKTTKELISDLRNYRGDNKWFIQYPKIKDFGKKWAYLISPYTIGCLLGDEELNYKASIRFTAADRNTNSLTEELRSMKLLGLNSYDKHIPNELLYTDRLSRLELLRGLLDTDGYVRNPELQQDKGLPSRHFSFTSVSEQLVNDVAYLVRSLGGRASVTRKSRKSGTSWEILGWLHTDEVPFKHPRKVKWWNELKPRDIERGKAIISIDYIGEREAQCIKLRGSEELYITDDFTVTHNTELATYATLIAVESGYQVGMLAPTDILATQLHERIINTLDKSSLSHLKIELLTGKLGVKQKREVNEKISSGETNVVVGTHAVISSGVEFNNLGLAIIDEQHKFGANQRNLLLEKGGQDGKQPDFLQMSATPIPRTVSQVVYGDMDITVVPQEIEGRIPIDTVWFQDTKEAYAKIREQVELGHQAYVVTALVEESEKLEDVESATQTWIELANKVFPDFNVELLHGKLKADEKDRIMNSYKDGKVDVLVSTSVIEVGVNVPNSTVMVILNANRFGLASLHQIRGRVGRGKDKSWCYLVGEATTPEAEERLLALCESNDGFWLAEKDLEIRGEGSLFETHQAGTNDMFLATLKEHKDMLEPTKLVAKQARKSVALRKEVNLLYDGKEIKA